jgi:hypothetical protein
MPYESLRPYLETLERADLIRWIDKEVDKDWEISALGRMIFRTPLAVSGNVAAVARASGKGRRPVGGLRPAGARADTSAEGPLRRGDRSIRPATPASAQRGRPGREVILLALSGRGCCRRVRVRLCPKQPEY